MKDGDQYIIPFKGLKDGNHVFDFEISDEFFETYSALEVKRGSIHVKVEMDKKPSMITMNVELSGDLVVECDRCLDEMVLPLTISDEVFIQFKEQETSTEDEVWNIHPNDDQVELEQYLMDTIGINIPIQKFHPDDENGVSTCNGEALAYYDDEAEEEQEEIDPRWSKLKDLFNDTK